MMSDNKSPQRKVRYIPVKQTLNSEELGSYESYGISVRTEDTELAFVSDVSTDGEAVEKLARTCTEQQLDPEQLEDVISDFLAELTLA